MAMPGISVDIQNEIQFLKNTLRSQRKVAKHLGLNRETVAKYWNVANPNNSINIPQWVTEIDWDYVAKEIKDGISIKTLYTEFSLSIILPAYENFARYIRVHKTPVKEPEISLKIDRIPGQTVEVDYSGDTMDFIDVTTGEIITAQLFVAAMSFSSYFYAEFTLSQKLPDFITSCRHSFEYFGKIPKFIVSDNCLTAIKKAEKHDFELNKTFKDFCHHYQVVADPARVYRPKDKPHVENSVGVIQKEFFQKYRRYTFTSLHEMNQKLREYLKEKMLEIVAGKNASRMSLFELELNSMYELPSDPYEIADYKICKVHPDCHIRHQRNFYSVPHQYVGKEVEVKFNHKIIKIYFNNEEVAVHSTMVGHCHYSTNPNHYPEKKLLETNYHIFNCLLKAKNIGPNTELIMTRMFNSPRNHPLRNLTKAFGILNLQNNYSKEAIEYGCESAELSNKLNYKYIENCAKNYRPSKEKISLLPSRQMAFVCLQGGLL